MAMQIARTKGVVRANEVGSGIGNAGLLWQILYHVNTRRYLYGSTAQS